MFKDFLGFIDSMNSDNQTGKIKGGRNKDAVINDQLKEKIVTMQEEKKKLISDVLDSNYTSENILRSLSNDELKSLFS